MADQNTPGAERDAAWQATVNILRAFHYGKMRPEFTTEPPDTGLADTLRSVMPEARTPSLSFYRLEQPQALPAQFIFWNWRGGAVLLVADMAFTAPQDTADFIHIFHHREDGWRHLGAYDLSGIMREQDEKGCLELIRSLRGSPLPGTEATAADTQDYKEAQDAGPPAEERDYNHGQSMNL